MWGAEAAVGCADDPPHPGTEVPVSFKGIELSPCRDESFLDDVLSGIAISRGGGGKNEAIKTSFRH